MKKTTKIERKNRTEYQEIEQNTAEAIVADFCGLGVVAVCMGAVIGIYDRIIKICLEE